MGRRVLLTRRDRRVRLPWPPVRRVLKRILEDYDARGTLSVVFVSDCEIGRLHGEFLGDERPTDVLSFPLGDDPGVPDASEPELGEVIVSTETAQREASRRKLPVAREVALYAIHGTLHLMGFDDLEPASRGEMRRRERHYVDLYRQLGGE